MGILNILIDNLKVSSSSDSLLSNALTGKADLSNVIKAGSIAITNDTAQTFTFDEAFTGSDADIFVVIQRTDGDVTANIPVTATTLTGFTVNRNASVDGTNGASYIAVNIGALTSVPVFG